ncbi:two-component system response regulator YesN [Paenibacillus endophyticus]|uniref:Two-component system response regulator YesN n=1 Tax=Paenibacillus endophyticus TaxID=1294268 RepID=A0A7W5CBS4_9BACL|nr:helix-turn-helix domain-containing protein [Paenibacillus endophyticus]MBB3154802.1 two-component system response regulator YesN [Paenibacillus endophyticus]
MYNLLVVDDEEIAIRGIVEGIDWSTLPIANIYTAIDAEEAQALLIEHTIHIMLSDIDMPNLSGIDLLEWVNEHSPSSVTIFLTGHADFKYAQQAVQLDCFDYLLKPIDHQALKACVKEALNKVIDLEQLAKIKDTYSLFYEQWSKQRPILIERFWHDVLHYRLSAAPQQLDAALQTYALPLKSDSLLRIVLISIEQWREEWSARDEEIMTYGIKNAAEELVLHGEHGHIVQDGGGIIYVLFYESLEHELQSASIIAERCKTFINQCKDMLHCSLSCYIGEPAQTRQLREAVQSLLTMERSNVSHTCAILLEQEHAHEQETNVPHAAPFSDWSLLLESGKQTELAQRIDEWFDQMQQLKVDYTYMASFYYGYMNMLFQWLNKKSVQMTDVFKHREWEAGENILKSLPRMRTWTQQLSLQITEYANRNGKDVSQVVDKVQRYMEEHLGEEFSREQVADAVYLNPAYLSRLFRRETGYSLTDYLVRLRIAKARIELEKTNNRVSDVASNVGYGNFSHFSKLFKKTTGLTPQEYRKKFQNV